MFRWLGRLFKAAGAAIVRFFCKIFHIHIPDWAEDEIDIGSPFDNDDPVCYYGCPNSKRVIKLNTSKENYKANNH